MCRQVRHSTAVRTNRIGPTGALGTPPLFIFSRWREALGEADSSGDGQGVIVRTKPSGPPLCVEVRCRNIDAEPIWLSLSEPTRFTEVDRSILSSSCKRVRAHVSSAETMVVSTNDPLTDLSAVLS